MPALSKARKELVRKRDEEIVRMYLDPNVAPTYKDIAEILSKRENPIYHMTWHNVAQIIRKWDKRERTTISID